MQRVSALIVAVVGGLAVLLAGCSSSATSDSAASPQTQQAAASGSAYSIKATGTVKFDGIVTANIQGGSINGSSGTVSLSALGQTYVGEITNATVSPTSLAGTLTLGGPTGQGTLAGTNYVYSGDVKSGSSTFVVSELTLAPQTAVNGAAPNDAANGNYAVRATGTVTASGVSAAITGGSISGATGTITAKPSILPFSITAEVTNAVITPTSFSGTITSSVGGGTGTLPGVNFVYSGTVTSATGESITVSNVMLVATS